uniref:Epiplakin 1 n=1 Tax=Hucho hucho TaxID=62062 RepID=A0A4W5KX94_9TELE
MLLEAHAASGYLIDPVKNRMLSVDEAVMEELICPELHKKMLYAEKAATAYKDPYTGDKIPLFEAMKKGLIEQDQAVRLLDAQIATGGIIDPVNCHSVPLQTAYKQGQLDSEINRTLSNPTADSKLFIDPSTQESLTYQQLLERCTPDAETGLLLLPVTKNAAQSDKTYTTEETKDVLTKANISVLFGRFQGKTVTVWEIINSEYFTEPQRKDLIHQYKTGKITIEKFIKIVISVVEDKEKKNEIVFDGLRTPVTAAELLESKIINKDLFNKLHNGKTTVKEISEMECVKKALRGTPSIAGVIVESTKEKIPFYQAVKKQILSPETALTLLEAQAGTGFVIDPVKNQKLTVDEAVKSGLVGPEMHEKLLSAERAVNGYKDPYTGKIVSLFQAMLKDLIKKDQGFRLLEAQLATGGIIDPVKSYRIPHDVACKRGYFEEEMNKTLSNNTDETKVFFDPNMWENVSYVQLMKKCVTDKDTGFPFLPLSVKAIQKSKEKQKSKENHQYTEFQIKDALNQATLELQYGPFKGRKVTIWEIINSEYITEEQRIKLIQQYRTGTVTIERIITILVTMVDKKETKKQEKEQASFEGLRAPVTASSLFESKIIDKATYDQLQQGKKKPKEISDMDSVRKYLQGTDGQIVGIYMGDSKEKVSIYQAMKKNILRQNTGLALLEVQAATGFIIDPVKNQRYTVNDAVKAGVVGPEVHEKLLSAEKAVTGFRDPYTGNIISLFQAMKKELVLREHAIPLLEAQVATGGIIDPVSSHRVPNDVAIQRGYFNKQMAKTFTDPTGDIKAFVYPNTNESYSYKQLQEKCIRDPDTSLCFLPLSKAEAQSPVEKSYVYTEEQAQTDLTNSQVDIPHQTYGGKVMTLWDVMMSNLLPEEEKLRLLEQYRRGKITKERMIIIVIEIIEQREILKVEQSMSCDVIRRRVTIEELYSSRIINLQTYNLLKQEKKTIREVMEMPSVKQYLFGTGSIAGILSDSPSKVSIYQALKRGLIKPDFAISLLEAQAATGFIIDPVKDELLTVDEAVRKGIVGPEIHDKLLSAERAVTGYKDPYSGKVISLFQAMKKYLVPEDYALRLLEAQAFTGGLMDPEYYFHLPTDVAMQRGYINKETYDRITDPNCDVQAYVDPTTEERQTYAQLLKRCKVDKESGLRLLSVADRRLLFKGLRKQITLDELLCSQIIDQKTYNDLTEGLISVEEVSREVKKYLEGTSCIAGVYVESSKDRLSIYQAMKKNMIRPGTAFELLEAQDMEGNDNGQAQGTGAVAGVFLEKTKQKITIYQAMKKRLLKPGTALALLEAQAATEGIIDLINNRKLPVEEALKEGIIGPEMREKLLVAERAIDGYIDTYTNEKMSVFQAIQKDVIPKDYGSRLLEAQISTKGLFDPVEKKHVSVYLAIEKGHYEKGLLSDQMEDLKVFYDPNSQENLNYSHLIEKCIVDPDTGLLLLPVCITFKGLRRGVSSTELLAANIIDKETYDDLQKGKTTTQDVMLMETVKEYLEGKGSISGVAMLSSNQRMSIYQAMKQGILMPGTALVLLEAQAATGFMIDPVQNKKFSVDEAVKNKVVGPDYHAKLLSAERAVTGYKDPYTSETISLFQALSKDLIVKEHGIRLLEAQIATGGIIDPINSHRLPVDVAYKRGFFGEDMNSILEDSGDDTKGFFDPNTKENLTYLQLMGRCVIDPATGLCLLPLTEQSAGQNHNFIDYQTKLTFKEVRVKMTCGKYMGMTVSLWELLMSEYFNEHQRQDIIQQYTQGHLTMKMMIRKIMEVIEQSVKTTKVIFEGIRETVTAKQLVEADIISENVLDELNKGKKTVKEVTEDETVQMYLQGKDSIAGVLLPDSQIMTIYQARQKGKLMPGTALILLEAQAATGFIIDPIANRKFSVDEAVKANIVGPDLHGKLRSAEKAVTGYKDPYTGKTISLFQAMQKDLILQDHGIRLLEAQIATGGIIDPLNSHRIPVHVAYKRGYFNEEMNQILDDPSDDTKGFFDPNTHENLTYLKLMARCVTDPSTGLCLLPLKGKSNRINIQDHIKETFQATNVTVKYGRFSCKHVTLWDLINSEYLCEDKRQELFKLYKSRMITIKEIIVIILEIIESKEMKWQAGLNFEGLRGNVSVVDLLRLEIVDEKTYKSLIEGKLTNKDIMKIDTVRTYLRGNSCVAGVILQPSSQKLSIYEAKKKGILTPGTALYLLEAQAATGFIIDPLHNQKLTVDHALKEKIIGPELYEKLLSAEKAVTGYTDPYTGKKISLFQAMKKDLILQQHGIRLLEAQIATGGIIDPLKCLHLPLEVAYRKGYFDVELNQILTDPSDDTKGFFDPRTQANLTYMEMMKQCIKDPETGLFFLPLMEKTKTQDKTERMYSDAEIKQEFEKTTVSISVGRYSGKTVSLWYLIHSGYFTDDQRLQFLEEYRTKKITIQAIITLVISTITKLEKNETLKTTMGLRKPVSAKQLLKSSIIDANTFKSLEEGKVTLEQVTKLESVKQYLRGTGSVAGVRILPSKKVMSIYEAKVQGLLTPGTALTLLEAQAATGFVIDPIKNKYLSVDEAAREQLIGLEIHEKLLSAERAVTGYVDPYTDDTISLFEAMEKDLIEKGHGIHLLEAQIATGGIIDPVNSYRIPSHVAKKNGYLDEETSEVLSNPNDDTKGFSDPSTKEKITYLQLRERCERDSQTGLLLLPLHVEAGSDFHADERTEQEFKDKIVVINAGKFEDKQVSLWDVLISEYISKLKREQLLKQYKTRSLTMKEIIEIIIIIIQEVTSKQIKFKGLRKQVSASELYESQIISKELFTQIIHGEVTEETVGEMESIQKYLGATNCIAGVRIESTKKIMSIYEAKTKGLLTPGTSLVLLEAQAATGFVIDPVKNKKLSVEEAAAQGVVGNEWKNKLLSAERAVTGYKDPYTGNTISLFQALKKDLIVKDHGIRLLEAQIATGGIIDPVYSHRVPVEVAYQRGYFDEEMNQILDDPDDDTKGFFDPNTQENLTYLQLVERCVTDPDTGLSLLVIVKKGEFYFFIDEQTKNILKAMTTTKAGGKFQGQKVSLWDLLYSKYITEERRRELVQQYKSGAITIDRFMEIILTTIQQKTTTTTSTTSSVTTCTPPPETKSEKTTITTTTTETSFHGIRKNVTAGELLALKKDLIVKDHGIRLLEAQIATGGIIDPVYSHRVPVEVAYQRGYFDEEMNQILDDPDDDTKGFFDPNTQENLTYLQLVERCVTDPDTGLSLLVIVKKGEFYFFIDEQTKNILKAMTTTKAGGKFQGQKVSLWDLLYSKYITEERRRELVQQYKSGYLEGTNSIAGVYVQSTKQTMSIYEAKSKGLLTPGTSLVLLEAQAATGFVIDPVKNKKLSVEEAAAQGVVGNEWKNKLLSAERAGFFDPNTQENLTYLQLVERCVTDPDTGLSLLVIVKKGEFYFFIDEQTKNILKAMTTTKAGGKFQGQKVSLWDLLYSKYITEERRRELVQQYKSGAITIDQKTTITTTTTETSFHGIRKNVTAGELLASKIIDKNLYEDLNTGKVTVDQVSEMDSVHKYLKGTNCIAGVYVQSTNQTMSIYEAKSKGLLTPGTSLVLLEAQAATGFVIDPVKNKKLSVEEAAAQGVVGNEWKNKLLSAERAVTGYKDPYTGNTISLFQALKKDLIVKDHGIRLLEAQIATGGIIDPVYSHRVPVEVAYQRGYFDEEMNQILDDPDDDTKAITIDRFMEIILTTIQQKTTTTTSTTSSVTTCTPPPETKSEKTTITTTTTETSFHGIRKNVTAGELLASKIIDKQLYEDINTGKVTVNQVSEMDSVHKYLEGTNSIAGVYVQSTKQTMSIYEAKSKGLLTPGTSLVLLEAQAATGFVIDPVKNKKLSVEEAAAQGVVGNEWKNKLLSAERAVTGYKDPYTGNTISLFQALKKDLIVKDHGIRLLEAQIATGGIIDPVYSHRVPVEVAYQRGYFDEEMNQILDDPDDDTKGFFDPNTQENLTYLQLLERCVRDPDTGLSFMSLNK